MSRLTFTTTCLACFGVGVWLGTPYRANLLLPELLAAVILTICSWRKAWVSCIGWGTGILLATGIGFCHVATYRSRLPKLPEHIRVSEHGTIVGSPDNRDDENRLTIRTSYQGVSVTILVHTPPFPKFAFGDEVTLTGTADRATRIEDFDYPLFLERQGVTHTMKRARISFVSKGKEGITSTLYSIRSLLETRIANSIPEPEASLLNGILLGSRQQLSEELVVQLRKTGTSHVVAISGANITIVVELLVLLMPLYSRTSQRNATILIGFALSIATGASASVVRGSLAAALGASVRAAGRPRNSPNIVLLPAVCMLIANPLYLRADPSFQLSLAAYSGIIFLTPLVQRVFSLPLKYIPEVLRATFTETSAATLATLPISITSFGNVSWIGLIANPALLWMLPLITAFGGAYLVFPNQVTTSILWILLHSFLSSIRVFSKLPS